MKQEAKVTANPTVYNRLMRYELLCSYCRPNKGENIKCRKKHGVQKPRKKNIRRGS